LGVGEEKEMKSNAVRNFLERDAARPVLKWAGGKGQILPQISELYPTKLKFGGCKRYIEPFIGGGAVFFDIANRFDVAESFVFDINPDLIILYNVIKNDVEDLIQELNILQRIYDSPDREKLYYFLRDKYNRYDKKADANKYAKNFIPRAALTVFLNKTCYNGLYRVNSRGAFNTPIGRYDNPMICDADNLRAAAAALQYAEVRCCDFSEALRYADKDSFVYYDPPYRPVSASSFNSYARGAFDDKEQVRLAGVFAEVDSTGALQMLSNSFQPDGFFDNLYAGRKISIVSANRMINSNSEKRGKVCELLITNY
jgi:DNA adenine methylase